MFTKNVKVYIKQTENSGPVLATDNNILQDIFPEFYNVFDEIIYMGRTKRITVFIIAALLNL